MEVGLHLRIERNIDKKNKKLLERKGNENSSKEKTIRIEVSKKCSTTGISFGTNNVF